MSIFSDINPEGSASPAFHRDRWPAILTSMEIKHGIDDDGDCFADWDTARVFFEGRGKNAEILVVRGIWDFHPPASAYEKVALFTCQWNATHLWPRASVHKYPEDDECLVFGDLIIDCETGVDDEFVRQQVRCALSTIFEMFEEAGKAFPEHTGWHNVGADS
ncbi:MAG: YbjN domain-containing protein [Propionibacteriaceae bacterium]|nr:YbjN domain-containing protein [Propionibacteriaceae bacterium]